MIIHPIRQLYRLHRIGNDSEQKDHNTGEDPTIVMMRRTFL